ncbi:MAG: ParB/RepB/Spo0J family partition protein [Spirochaetaceae bacterium]|nr:ParB/RepB/Spo0J family partition protein [Spirochaetaceae bacterium]
MVAKSALGKGLDSLLQQYEDNTDLNSNDGVKEIQIKLIIPNPDQPRKTFNDEALKELADSIREQGVIQPIILEKNGDRYIIVAGERRFRASRLAGLDTIPGLIRTYTHEQKLEIALIENIQREDLNSIEEAKAYLSLMNNLDLSQDAIARKVGKNRSTIANSLRLLKLPEDIQNSLIEGDIYAGHARAILSAVNPSDMRILYSRILSNNLSVRESEKQAAELNNGIRKQVHVPVKASKKPDPEIRRIEQKFLDALGTKVSVRGGLKKGKIEIDYYSLDDLERIYDMLVK